MSVLSDHWLENSARSVRLAHRPRPCEGGANPVPAAGPCLPGALTGAAPPRAAGRGGPDPRKAAEGRVRGAQITESKR